MLTLAAHRGCAAGPAQTIAADTGEGKRGHRGDRLTWSTPDDGDRLSVAPSRLPRDGRRAIRRRSVPGRRDASGSPYIVGCLRLVSMGTSGWSGEPARAGSGFRYWRGDLPRRAADDCARCWPGCEEGRCDIPSRWRRFQEPLLLKLAARGSGTRTADGSMRAGANPHPPMTSRPARRAIVASRNRLSLRLGISALECARPAVRNCTDYSTRWVIWLRGVSSVRIRPIVTLAAR